MYMYTSKPYEILVWLEYVKGCGPSKPGRLETREEKLKCPNHSQFARPQQKAMTLREKSETRD